MAAAISLVAPAKWSDLPAEKQRILAPLSAEWSSLEWWRRKKWLEIADRYPKMTQPEQERMQQRMQAWARLTPEERKVAREKYRNIQNASTEQQAAVKQMWFEYEMLPDEEKQRLRNTAGKPSAGTAPGMAPAAKPTR